MFAVMEVYDGWGEFVYKDKLTLQGALDVFAGLCGIKHRVWLDEVDYPDNLYSSIYYVKRMDADDRSNQKNE